MINSNTDALRLFKALNLLFLPNFPDPMFIPCPTSIPDSRVQNARLKLAEAQSELEAAERQWKSEAEEEATKIHAR